MALVHGDCLIRLREKPLKHQGQGIEEPCITSQGPRHYQTREVANTLLYRIYLGRNVHLKWSQAHETDYAVSGHANWTHSAYRIHTRLKLRAKLPVCLDSFESDFELRIGGI
ncbi:hypothetical protein BaRGS_00012359 [Batillaria attramentaria]|uniref:Uncharacterized protein n=1 Tax=Batillaria attramentaria TaxID=370345 RepID=A0ABD0LBV3_9CAEN